MNIFRSLQVELLDGRDGHYGVEWGGAGKMAIRDDFSRLYLLRSGRAEVRTAERTVELTPGRLYLFPCGKTAWYRCVEPMRLCWVHFRLEFLPGLDIFARYEPPVEMEKIKKAEKEFKLLLDEQEEGGPESLLRSMRALLRLSSPFLPRSWEQLAGDPPAVERLKPALEYLRGRLARPELTLAQVARSVSLHPTYFSNLFREVLGVTPMQLLTELRVRQARTMLATTGANVAEIAAACGYPDPFYFTRVFKKNTGLSPREFRNSAGIFGGRTAGK